MNQEGPGVYRIRALDPDAPGEVRCVAERMRDTLIEVEGAARGADLYSLDWLEARVRWHLDADKTHARVLVATDEARAIVGHTIFRVESPDEAPFGLISTTYVLPAARRAGCAARFVEAAHDWLRRQHIATCCTYTSSTHRPLIALYARFGYRIVETGKNDLLDTIMVKLAVDLDAARRG